MTWIRLFHSTSPVAAEAILRDGFRDRACMSFPPGVWLCNRVVDCNEGAKTGAVFEVLIDTTAAELFDEYEVHEPDKPYREFLFPARVLNDPQKCHVRLLSLEEEEQANNQEPWSEYPEGEPARTWELLRADDSAQERGEEI